MDKRTLSHKPVNIYKRKRYRLIPAVREAALRRTRARYSYQRQPLIFNFDGEEYVIIREACKILNIKPHTFRRLQYHGIIPDLPKHPNGRRYIIRLSNVKLLKFAIDTIVKPDDEASLTIPVLRNIRQFVTQYWNQRSEYFTSESAN